MGRTESVALAQRARRLLVKAGRETLRFDAQQKPITEAEVHAYLVHEDGFLRVPVLLAGELLVRGYTEELYREALGPSSEGGAR